MTFFKTQNATRSAFAKRYLAGTALLSGLVALGTAASAAEPAKVDIEEIVVTGSIISNPNYVSASPISVTSVEDMRASGVVAIETVLNQMPNFSATGTAGNGGQGTGGHATLNLRGLGSNRNLVLLDGRRLPLASIQGEVDINLIPEAILNSVDIITGGASAVYGSDAMSGVVNFKTMSKFRGVIGDVQYGNSFKGDISSITASVAGGTEFADGKGSALLSISYTDRSELAGSKRSFFNLVTPSSFIGQGTFVPDSSNLPTQAAVNALFTSYGVAATVPRTNNLGFNDGGTLFSQTGAINYRGPTAAPYAIIAGNVRMPVGPQTLIQNPLNRKSVFAKADYDISDNVTAYTQVLYVDSTVTTSSGGSLTQFGTLTTIPLSNPFIPQDLRTLLASRPNPGAAFTWNGRYVGLPYKAWDETYTTSQFLGGLRGNLGFKDWTWDVYASYDTMNHLQQNYNAVLKSRVQTLLSAADGGNSICAGGFNPFSVANSTRISAACQAYMTTTANSTERLTQINTQAVIQGTLFDLPAGGVNLALLADYRRNTYRYSPDANLASQNIEAVIASAATTGQISVKEFAAQVDVPVLKDSPIANKFNVGAAYRHSDYSTSGGTSAYEGDIKWQPFNEDLLIRGSYQRAVRAPNIGELFAANSGGQIAFGTPPGSIGDPCDIRSTARTGAGGSSVRSLCLAQGMPANVVDGYTFPTTATAGLTFGNRALTPEKANTYNVGFAWRSSSDSRWAKGLSVSVDYYNISITNVISVIPGLTALSKCYNLDGSNPSYAASNVFCALLHRDSNGLLQQIDTPYFNLGGLKTDGIDVQIGWALDVADGDQFLFNTAIGYKHSYAIQTLPNTAFQQYAGTNTIVANGSTAGTSFPKWKALTTFAYDFGDALIGLRWHFTDGMKDVSSVTTPAAPGIGVHAYNLLDVYGTYDINETIQIRGGINNFTNRGLPIVSSSQTSTDTATFDPIGRAFYIGLRLKH